MKIATFAGALLLSIPLSTPAAEKDLHGTWKLVSQSQKLVDTGEVRAGRGAAPKGYVTFTPDGRVIGMIMSEKRPKPESVAKLTDAHPFDSVGLLFYLRRCLLFDRGDDHLHAAFSRPLEH